MPCKRKDPFSAHQFLPQSAPPCAGLPVLRLVVLETAAACVQLSQDLAAADVGLAAFDTAKPVQV